MKRKFGVLLVVLSLLVALVWWRIQSKAESTNTRRQNTPLVKTTLPQIRETFTQLTYTGDIQAAQQATISPKVTGTLAAVFADLGDVVHTGQLLAQLDTVELAQQVIQTQATHRNAQQNFTRFTDLFSKKLASQQDLDNAQTAAQIAKANYDAAQIKLDYTHILAPFSGVIAKRFQDAGSIVTANVTQLFTLVDLHEVKLSVNIPEKEIARIKVGMTVEATVDAYAKRRFSGKVSRMGSALDLATRTMPVEIRLPNPTAELKPGMFAKAIITLDAIADAMMVPNAAVVRDANGTIVYRIINCTAKRTPIVAGVETEDAVQVLKGLSETDSIAVVGVQFLRDGVNVNVQK